MRKKAITVFAITGALILNGFLESCKQEKKQVVENSEKARQLTFQQRKVVDSAKFWWAHVPADITDDGVADLVFINNNATGGYLGYYEGKKEKGLWKLHVIADYTPTGGLFASGDLEVADVDGDGDTDIFAVKHPGEWADAGATAKLFWYENMDGDWKPHAIGEAPDAVKDVSFADFDNDGKQDVAILTFDEHTLSIFRQHDTNTWQRVQYIRDEVLHEGMDIGDVDGDGDLDIVATGLVYYNPGSDLKQPWSEENLDKQWNNQEGDWSRNGTKIFIRDIDSDGKGEIFIAHSERGGYPLVMYSKNDKEGWQHIVVKDSIAANHTLQVFDFDLDGDMDIYAGVNKGRAVNLGKSKFPVYIFLNDGDNQNFTEMVIESNGVYNGQAMDYDGDGDIDLFRYPDHESKDFFVLENKIE